MPTLSLMLTQSGPPPEGEPARANSGTEGREGNLAASTNGSETENTWTRVFQSYTQSNKQAATSPTKPTTKSEPDKAKLADDASTTVATAATVPVTPVAVSTTFPLTASQVIAATPVVEPGYAIAKQPVSGISARSNLPALSATPVNTNSTISATPPPTLPTTQVRLSVHDENVASPSGSDLLPTPTTPKSRPNQKTTPVVSNQTVKTVVVNQPLVAQISPPLLTTAPLTVAKSYVPAPTVPAPTVPSSLPAARPNRQTLSSPVSGRTISPVDDGQSAQVSPSTQDLTTSTTTGKAATTVVAPASVAQFTLPVNLQAESISALQNAKYSTNTSSAPTIGAPQKTSVGLATKAGMERSQVLGDSSPNSHALDSHKDSASGDSGFSADSSRGTGDKSSAEPGQSAPDGSFSGVLSNVNTSNASAAGITNVALVQSSSHDERMAVVNQISAHIQSMQPTTSDPNTMTVTVQPMHWGEVKIAVALSPQSAGVSGSNITATVTSANSEVSGVIQRHAQDLKDSLSSIGLHLDKLNVGVGTVAAMSQSGSSSGHHAGQQGNGSGSQDQQLAWSGQSAGSGSSPFQSSTDWGGQNEDAANDESNLMEAATVVGVSPATASGGTNTTRIDVRA